MKKSSNFVNLDNIFKEDVPDYQNKTGIITDKRPRVIVERDHTGKYRLTVKGNFDPSPERINKTMGEKPDRNNLMRQSWDVAVRDIEINAKDTFERNEGLLRSKFGLAPQKDNEKNENYKSAPQLVNPRADLFKYSYVAKYQKKDNDFNINAYLVKKIE